MNQVGGKYIIRRNDLLYPELSYKINGILFDVHNEIGGNVPEKYIQKAVNLSLSNKNIPFKEQLHVPIIFQGQNIGRYYLDFLIDNKIILELKRGKYAPRAIFNQTLKYLDALNLELAIIACFAHDSVIIKRVVNHKKIQQNKFVHSDHS